MNKLVGKAFFNLYFQYCVQSVSTVYSVFSIQLRVACRVWTLEDTSDMVGAGYMHMFWDHPNGSGTGSMSSLLPH